MPPNLRSMCEYIANRTQHHPAAAAAAAAAAAVAAYPAAFPASYPAALTHAFLDMLFLTHALRPVARWCATTLQPQTFSPGRPEMQRAHPLFRWVGPYCTSQRSQEPQLVKFHGLPPILVGWTGI